MKFKQNKILVHTHYYTKVKGSETPSPLDLIIIYNSLEMEHITCGTQPRRSDDAMLKAECAVIDEIAKKESKKTDKAE